MKTNKMKPVKIAVKSGVKNIASKPAPKAVTKSSVKPEAKPVVKPTVKPAPKAVAKPASKPVAKPIPAPVIKQVTTPVATPDSNTVTAVESLRQEVTALRSQLAKYLSPVASGTIEEVDALRRVLSDLMEARMNDVIRELVVIRNTAAAGNDARHIAEQMDALLADLGAMKFEADRLEYVDPLIHTVTKEVSDASLPDGVILETVRPGFHTGRGIVVAKALVAMNRRP